MSVPTMDEGPTYEAATHEAAFWSELSRRLATEFGQALLASVRAWTAAAHDEELEALDALREEVDAVGFLLGCLGAARGSDALRERRETTLVRHVLVALTRPLEDLRALRPTWEDASLPRIAGARADWRPALLVAWATWRAEGEGEVRLRAHADERGVELRFPEGVAWDADLLAAWPTDSGLEATASALRFHREVLAEDDA